LKIDTANVYKKIYILSFCLCI